MICDDKTIFLHMETKQFFFPQHVFAWNKKFFLLHEKNSCAKIKICRQEKNVFFLLYQEKNY